MNTLKIVTGVAVAALSSAAFADDPPQINFNMNIGGSSVGWVDGNGQQGGPTDWNYNGQQSADMGGMTYVLQVDADPFIGFSYEFFNNTASTQTFTVTMTLPVLPWNQGTVIGASLGGSVTDANFDGVGTLSTVQGSALFQGSVDSNLWLPLYNDPFQVNTPYFGGTSTIGPNTAGLPGPTIPGPFVVTTDMSIKLTFNLTAGDRASFTGIFVMNFVPAPAGALALLGLVGLRRRRTA